MNLRQHLRRKLIAELNISEPEIRAVLEPALTVAAIVLNNSLFGVSAQPWIARAPVAFAPGADVATEIRILIAVELMADIVVNFVSKHAHELKIQMKLFV